nr:MAG TPA: Tail fiber family protein [Caudoviricetes sp.]
MYTTSTAYKTEIQKRSRAFECRVTIGDRVFTNNEVQSIDLSGGIQDVFSIGNTPSMCLELVLRNTTDTIFTTNSVKVEIGLKIGSTIEYIPLGIFNIEDIKKDDYTTKFTCYDNMTKFEIAYFSSLGDKPTLQQVVNELASKTGVQFTGSLPSYTVKKLEGFTCREVLGYVASLCGGNAIITREGKFTIVYPTDISRDVGEGVFDLQRDEVKYKIGKITCQVKEQETISKGSLGTDNMELSFENPWVTETILTDIYNRLNGLNYLGYTMKWQGDLSLDIGDIITYTDVKGVTRKLPILYRKLSYDGGLDSELSAKGETKNKNSFNSSGSMSNKVNRLVTEQAIIKEAIIEKANIEDLKAINAEIANLKVKDAEIEDAVIKKATIEQLNATNANIQNLIAEDARINNLVASKASITELNAVSAKIGTVEADTAIIKDLLAGNVTAGSGQIIHLTAKNVTIEDAVIKNLIAAKLSVADLQAGTISTNKFTIASTDGGLSIVGPTMQFKDKNNKVRIQMGQDTQGNFNFILRGADGTTTLIDHTGIKEKAIADDLIKSNMVAADAIGEKQINYSSLITGLNKDDNTSLIKASKVEIDLEGQSLEVAFTSLKSTVDNIDIVERNLFIGSSSEYKEVELGRYAASIYGRKHCSEYGLKVGDTFTYSVDFKSMSEKPLRARVDFFADKSGDAGKTAKVSSITIPPNGEGRSYLTATIEEGKEYIVFYVANGDATITTTTKEKYKCAKLEIGDKSTEWTPAPEDIDKITQSLQTQITVAQGKIEGLIKDTTITEGSSSTSLKDAYISLKATVNGLNSTVASHTSSISTVTTELGKVDGKINTAKADAISTAGADATSKANNALNSAKSYTNAQITTVNTRVSNAESSITQLNNSITNKVWQTDINKAVSTITPDVTYAKDYVEALENNKGYRYKHDVIVYGDSDKYYPVIIKGGNQWVRRKIVVSRSYGEQAPNDWNNATHKGALNVVIDTNFGGWGGTQYSWSIYALSQTYANTFAGCMNCGANVMFAIFLRGGGETGALYHLYSDQSLVTNIYNKLPDGTVLPAPQIAYNKDLIFYSPKSDGTAYEYYAPPPRTLTKEVLEEIQSRLFIDNANQARKDIATITTEVTTVKEKAATLETNLNGITSKVTNLESTTSTINGKVNSQETRLQSTEQKVTATGVITTITEAINAGTNSLTTMQFILDKNGATIKNGALRILNKTGKAVLSGDSNGNLTMTGDYVNIKDNGITALKISDSNIYFYNWEVEGQILGRIYSSRISTDNSKKGIGIGHDLKSYVHIGGKNEGASTYTSYIDFDRYNIKGRNASQYYDSEIIVNGHTFFSGQVRLQRPIVVGNPFGCIRFTQDYLYGDGTIGKLLTSQTTASSGQMYGDVALLGRRGSNPNPNAYCVVGQLLSNSEYSYERTLVVSSSGVDINGNLRVTGTKNRLIETQNFGNLCLNAYETTGSWFGDLGRGIIDNTGVCYIYFDPKFIEAVNTNFDYNVFLQKYGQGDLWVEDKQHDYFVVKGTPNLEFAWEAKCKQRGYETDRLEETYEKCRAVNYIDEIPEEDESYLDGLKI